jgi:hypothetical protein
MPKLFLIDDDPLKRSWLDPQLDELGAGWTPGFSSSEHALESADELLDAARSGAGCVVLLDVYMPRQRTVANAVVTKLQGTNEGVIGDGFFRAVGNDEAYRLACYLMAVCIEHRTPLLTISTIKDPTKSIGALEYLQHRGINPPQRLPWPDQTGVGAWWRKMLLRLRPHGISSVPCHIREILSSNAAVIRACIDPYSDFQEKWSSFSDCLARKGPWPCPNETRTPFDDANWHSVTGTGWQNLAAIPATITEKLDQMFLSLVGRLPQPATNLPSGNGGIQTYWPVAAAKGLLNGWISVRLAEWLLGLPPTLGADYRSMFRGQDDSDNAQLLSALVMLGTSDRNGNRFTVDVSINANQIRFSFKGTANSVTEAQTVVAQLNMDPVRRATMPGRNGNPGQATLARHKLQKVVNDAGFVAIAKGSTVSIEGTFTYTFLV